MSAEQDHIDAMWSAADDFRYDAAANAALRAADFVGARTAEGAAVLVTQAQVYATLALVEQQRIANLIALSVPQEYAGAGQGQIRIPSYGPDGALRDDIREALGL